MLNDTELLQKLMVLSEETDESLLEIYLELAEDAVLERLYPYGADDYDIPVKYSNIVLELALRFYMRRGAEGENYHSENGVNRTYNSDNKDLLDRIVPRGKLM